MKNLLFFLFVAASVSAQGISLKKGTVMDSIRVNDTLTSTYSLYIPTGFTAETPMPAIFIFDEEGRGLSAARMFQQAAEEQGYILVSSNDVTSGVALEESLTSALVLIQEVVNTLPIDLENISVAGFADGADVATSVPLILDKVHGVIYIGGQHFNFEFISEDQTFLAIGLIGSQQAERNDIWGASQHLDFFGKANQLYIFEGGKQWPDTPVIGNAVGALTLEAMRTKKRPQEPRLIAELYQRDLAFANDLINRNELMAAGEFLEKLEEKYKGLTRTREAEDRLRQLKRSSGYKDQEKKFRSVMDKQNRLMADFYHYLGSDVNTANYANLGWWSYQKMELEKLRNSSDQMEASMGARLLHWMKQVSGDEVEKAKADRYSLDSKMTANMIATIFDQQNFGAYRTIISLSAQDRDFSTALFYLEEMLKNGYTDREALYKIDGTLGLKTGKEFNWLIKKYLGSSKYYDNATSLY